ncbi:hypothetical protein [Burkholderia ubonensis]|uniref:hypothetical protein n=1 Tax=Burkholderia ubonensis TaxID=101571 RepID=UPI0012F87FFA|nr:hypothetical protein [Burkholderia ubonensis]
MSDDVGQVFDVPHGDGSFPLGVEIVKCRLVGPTTVDGDRAGVAVSLDGPTENSPCCNRDALRMQQEVIGVASLVERAVHVLPLAAHQIAGFVHAPVSICWPLMLAADRVQRRQ